MKFDIIEIEVDFSHRSGYWGSEIFIFDPTDLRKMPFLIKECDMMFLIGVAIFVIYCFYRFLGDDYRWRWQHE